MANGRVILLPSWCPQDMYYLKSVRSFTTEPEKYAHPHAPGITYTFNLDIWQLCNSLSDFRVRPSFYIFALLFSCLLRYSFFQSTIPAIDEVITLGMANIDPVHRLDAKGALAVDHRYFRARLQPIQVR